METLHWILIVWVVLYAISMSCISELSRRYIILKRHLSVMPAWFFYLISFITMPLYIIPSAILWVLFIALYIKIGKYNLTWQVIADELKKRHDKRTNL